MNEKTEKRAKAPITVDFDFRSVPHCEYDLVPCGFYYNRELAVAKAGDLIESYDCKQAKIVDVCEVQLRSRCTDLLSRMRYGVPILRKLRDWRYHATLYGHSKDVVNKERCLMIAYKILTNEENSGKIRE